MKSYKISYFNSGFVILSRLFTTLLATVFMICLGCVVIYAYDTKNRFSLYEYAYQQNYEKYRFDADFGPTQSVPVVNNTSKKLYLVDKDELFLPYTQLITNNRSKL